MQSQDLAAFCNTVLYIINVIESSPIIFPCLVVNLNSNQYVIFKKRQRLILEFKVIPKQTP